MSGEIGSSPAGVSIVLLSLLIFNSVAPSFGVPRAPLIPLIPLLPAAPAVALSDKVRIWHRQCLGLLILKTPPSTAPVLFMADIMNASQDVKNPEKPEELTKK